VTHNVCTEVGPAEVAALATKMRRKCGDWQVDFGRGALARGASAFGAEWRRGFGQGFDALLNLLIKLDVSVGRFVLSKQENSAQATDGVDVGGLAFVAGLRTASLQSAVVQPNSFCMSRSWRSRPSRRPEPCATPELPWVEARGPREMA